MTAMLLSLLVAPAKAEFDPDIIGHGVTVYEIGSSGGGVRGMVISVSGEDIKDSANTTLWAKDRLYWFWAPGTSTVSDLSTLCSGSIGDWQSGLELQFRATDLTSDDLTNGNFSNCNKGNASVDQGRDTLQQLDLWVPEQDGMTPYNNASTLKEEVCEGQLYRMDYKKGSSGNTTVDKAGYACHDSGGSDVFGLFAQLTTAQVNNGLPDWLVALTSTTGKVKGTNVSEYALTLSPPSIDSGDGYQVSPDHFRLKALDGTNTSWATMYGFAPGSQTLLKPKKGVTSLDQ